MKEQSKFKQEHSLEKRKEEAAKIKNKHPQRIPVSQGVLQVLNCASQVIVEKFGKCSLPSIDKKKYLVPGDLTVGQFVYVIRKRIKLEHEKTLFIFINNVLPATGDLMMTVYDKHKDEDGFLYVVYHAEKALGQLDIV